MKTQIKHLRQGFTLVELLIVISIIAVLAGVALPAIGKAKETADRTASASNAGNIFKMLTLYASDNDGAYPKGESSSNDAFRQLFIEGIAQDEKPFKVTGSQWHSAAKTNGPDGDIGSAPNYEQALERGENHWAYTSGLNQTSNGNLPIIMDGFVEGQIGSYTNLKTKKGGVWGGSNAIIVYTNGSAVQEKLDKREYKVKKKSSGSEVDLFSSSYSEELSTENILNPEG
jgi:prepilin-type N-terminal cleavage/methylation domain-containing protein